MFLIKKMKEQYEQIENKSTSNLFGKLSVYYSIGMIFYSFIFIGTTIESNMQILIILSLVRRIIGFILGLFLFYITCYMTYYQLKLNHKWIGYLAMFLNFISIVYFLIVVQAAITEM